MSIEETTNETSKDKPELTDPIQRVSANNATSATAYWRANIRVVLCLLVVWFTVSFGFGIIAVDELNKIQFYGFKLGFWWAQQGSIYVFVVLIFVYAWLMHRIDRKYGVSDDPSQGEN